MSHKIPSYYRYVESIAITNAGSGYDSANPPTLSFSGGGGTGAAATCTVVGGQIDTVTITNPGTGYTSAPTITLTSSVGSSGVLTASLSFASGPSTEFTDSYYENVKYTLPEFIRDEYPKFITFIEKYYEWMNQDGNPINSLLNAHFGDIDEATDAQLEKWRVILAKKWPVSMPVDKKFFYKRIKDIYESKGTKSSIEAFFRLFYGEDVDVKYPSNFILRASDGRWKQDQTVKATSGNNYEVLNLTGTLVDIYYYSTTGSVTVLNKIPASVTDVIKLAYTNPQQYDVTLKFDDPRTTLPGPGANGVAVAVYEGPIATVDTVGAADASRSAGTYTIGASDWTSDGAGSAAEFTVVVDGTGDATVTIDVDGEGFVIDETITIADANLGGGGGAALTFDVATLVEGELKINDVTVSNAGLQYTAAPTLEIIDSATSSPGSGAEVRVVVENGLITDYVVSNKGSGYTSTSTNLNLLTTSVPTFIVARDATPSSANIKAYIGRSLISLSAATYSGADAGFIDESVFVINEAGDAATGYALDYFAEDYVEIGGSNNAFARIKSVGSTNAPLTWEVIDSGYKWTKAQVDVTLTSPSGETATVTATTNYLFTEAGSWQDDRGKLSDINVMQDNRKYQDFSYIIKSTNVQSDWDQAVRDTIHPAGWEVFGELTVVNEISFDMSVSSPGFIVRYFADSFAVSAEVVAIHYDKVFTDSASASEAHAIAYSKDISGDSIVANDAGGQTYFAEDYVDNEYYVREGGISIAYSKVDTDTATATESISPVVDWERELTETVTLSEVVSPLLEILRSHSDTATTTETFEISRLVELTDSASASEAVDSINYSKAVDENALATESIDPVVSWTRSFSESPPITETVVKSLSIPFTDSATTSETVVTQIFIPLSLTDSASASESSVISIGKNISETPSVTDEPVINTSKPVSETVTNTETVAKTVAQAQTETVTNTEVATANVQDYADPTYFDADYVGTNYTLT